MVGVLRRVDVEEEAHHLRAAGAELDRLRGARLRQPPDLRIVERPVDDLVDDARPAPAGVDLVQQRARRIAQPGRSRLFRLQVVPLEPGPPLQRVVMPGSAGHVVVAVQVAVRDDVEPGALLVGDHGGQRVAELLAVARVHHAGVERLAPHAHVEPARPRPRPGDGGGRTRSLVTVSMGHDTRMPTAAAKPGTGPGNGSRFRLLAIAIGAVVAAGAAVTAAAVAGHGGDVRTFGWIPVRAGSGFAARVAPNGPASGALHDGDRIVAVDGDRRAERVSPSEIRHVHPRTFVHGDGPARRRGNDGSPDHDDDAEPRAVAVDRVAAPRRDRVVPDGDAHRGQPSGSADRPSGLCGRADDGPLLPVVERAAFGAGVAVARATGRDLGTLSDRAAPPGDRLRLLSPLPARPGIRTDLACPAPAALRSVRRDCPLDARRVRRVRHRRPDVSRFPLAIGGLRPARVYRRRGGAGDYRPRDFRRAGAQLSHGDRRRRPEARAMGRMGDDCRADAVSRHQRSVAGVDWIPGIGAARLGRGTPWPTSRPWPFP